jgi:16S rRNA (uracil1498-N3)-methyltransferase
MGVSHFFVPASDIEGDRVRFSPEQAHQVCHVLRLKAGDTVVVLDDSGTEYDVTLTAGEAKEAFGRVTGTHPALGEPKVEVALFQSALTRDKFEWVLQKGTEVGVSQFVPVLTQRSLVRARIEKSRLDRWRRILAEAAEQSHRGRIPKIEPIIPFDEAVSRLRDFDHSIIAAPSERPATLRDALQESAGRVRSVAVMVGPEGGFAEDEVAMARDKGAVQVSLGPRILRTETAAVVVCALVLHELGEMGI